MESRRVADGGRRARVAVVGVMLAASLAALAADHHDDFGAATASWSAGAQWHVVPGAAPRLVVDAAADSFAWRTDWPLRHTWSVTVDMTIAELKGNHGSTGAAGVALSAAGNPGPKILVTVTRHASNMTLIELQYSDGDWRRLLSSGWLPGADRDYKLRLERRAGDDFLHLAVSGDQGLSYESDTPPVPRKVLESLAAVGLRGNAARVAFASAALTTPNPESAWYGRIANLAAGDLLVHFWTGDAATGYVAPTWNGYRAAQLPDPRGALWDRGTLLRVLDNLGGEDSRQRIAADWKHTKAVYTAAEFGTAGTSVNPACDDCGWNALTLLLYHRVTGDPDALADAHALVTSAFDRWQDEQLGGGLWYSNERKHKSLYQVGLVLAALDLDDAALRARALSCYDWMETHLLRPDGLYWCDCGADGPVGANRPNDIHEAGSVTFLAGNMGMGVLHARRYRATHDDTYLKRAQRTADAVLAHLTDGHGVLLDERDAWANGTFAGEWAREVLTLPGMSEAHRDLLRDTAAAIAARARTADGYYGGCWNGPADGPASVWSRGGSRPGQLMTSANAVNVVVAAAALGDG
jgi:hypothetical protein